MVRNILFLIFFYIGIISICIFYLPTFLLPHKITLTGGKLMGHWSKFCLNLFLSTNVVIKGRENIINNEKFFIVCSHQSMFETFFLQTIFNSPVFILKKELLLIPIFGWYLKKIGSISIHRNKIKKENLNFFEQITSNYKKTPNRPLIIFPQGTRVLPTERPEFKKGVSKIYEELKLPCQPIAINSGHVWPKKGIKSYKKDIVVSILKPIEPGFEKQIFLKNIQNLIYSELDSLN